MVSLPRSQIRWLSQRAWKNIGFVSGLVVGGGGLAKHKIGLVRFVGAPVRFRTGSCVYVPWTRKLICKQIENKRTQTYICLNLHEDFGKEETIPTV